MGQESDRGPPRPPDRADLTPTEGTTGSSHTTLGPYRLLEKVGEGGMGEVWAAEQTSPIHRHVAIKIIKRGMDTAQVIARFEAERQALAIMDHPVIARVYEAGETVHGRPYFVMEFVEGLPITEYCDRNRLGTRERLELFLQVCEGVQHAHHKAIIHRDLKPGNVLVSLRGDRAVPKIIDFGVAKAIGGHLTERTMYTHTGALIGTPEYMSPEQANLSTRDVDTRTDVYSLGMMLYEVLTGSLPFEPRELRRAGFDEIRRWIREVEPPRPSHRITASGTPVGDLARRRRTEPGTLVRQLRGDLDWITMKAIEKLPERRYGSPTELAEDIRRYLRDVPVYARPPSTAYRAWKFVRRHRIGVASATALLVVLVAFAVTMAVQATRIARERDRANREAATATRVSGFLKDIFEVSDPREGKGSTVTARELLDRGAERAREELAGEPAVQASLLGTIGGVYRSLGLYDEAVEALEAASALYARLPEPDDAAHGEVLNEIGQTYRRQGRYDESVAAYLAAMERIEAGLGPDALELSDPINSLAVTYKQMGRYEEAEVLARRALAIRERHLGPEDPELAAPLNNLAMILDVRSRSEEAESTFLRSLAILEKAHGEDHPDLATVLANLANFHVGQRQFAEAETYVRRALAIQQKILDPDHPDVAQSLYTLAMVCRYREKYDESEALYRQVIRIREEALGKDHPQVGKALNNLAKLLTVTGRHAEAEPMFLRAIEIKEAGYGTEHPSVAVSLFNLGRCYAEQGRLDEALPLIERATGIAEAAYGPDHARARKYRESWAQVLRALGREEEAAEVEG